MIPLARLKSSLSRRSCWGNAVSSFHKYYLEYSFKTRLWMWPFSVYLYFRLTWMGGWRGKSSISMCWLILWYRFILFRYSIKVTPTKKINRLCKIRSYKLPKTKFWFGFSKSYKKFFAEGVEVSRQDSHFDTYQFICFWLHMPAKMWKLEMCYIKRNTLLERPVIKNTFWDYYAFSALLFLS